MQYKVYNDILRRSVVKSPIIHKEFLGKNEFVEAKDILLPGAQDASAASTTLTSSLVALQAVYASAQFLKLEIFGKKFDHDADMCIDRRELNKVIISLLESKRLDDK
jgi:hypothetical protein